MILSNDNKYRGNMGSSLKLDEYSHVEHPFIEQLKGLGWNSGKIRPSAPPNQKMNN